MNIFYLVKKTERANNKTNRKKYYLEIMSKQAKVKEYEHQIDQMVYKLYGLTEEEIEIVEGEK